MSLLVAFAAVQEACFLGTLLTLQRNRSMTVPLAHPKLRWGYSSNNNATRTTHWQLLPLLQSKDAAPSYNVLLLCLERLASCCNA